MIKNQNTDKLPNRKKKLLTKEFLEDFRDEIIRLDDKLKIINGLPREDYGHVNYLNFFCNVPSTGLFYTSLENICAKHNLLQSIYIYIQKLPWEISDILEDEIFLIMVEKGIIEEGYDVYDEEVPLEAKYKLIKRHKGYNVVDCGDWFPDNKESLEEIYKNSEWELIWLN